MKPEWRLKLRLLTARTLIKLGKITHADYSSAELKEALDKHLPETFKVDVPISKGELTLLEAEISMPANQNAIHVELLGSLIIGPAGNPIYRAHVLMIIEVYPTYEVVNNTVKVEKIIARDVRLVNDKYSIIEDSRDLLSLVFPKSLQDLLSGTVKSAFGLMTAGGSDLASNYLKLYLSGSKQRILDYHKPQIETLISEFAQTDDLHYQLNSDDFEERLFCLYGKEVVVEDGHLRFKF
jgi:hypothetical protein